MEFLKEELKTDETGVWALFGSLLFVVVVVTGGLIKIAVKRCKKPSSDTQEEASRDISREDNIELAEAKQNDLISLFTNEKNNITLLTVGGVEGLNEEEYVE